MLIGAQSLQRKIIGSHKSNALKKELLEKAPAYALNALMDHRKVCESRIPLRKTGRLHGDFSFGNVDINYTAQIFPIVTKTGIPLLMTHSEQTIIH